MTTAEQIAMEEYPECNYRDMGQLQKAARAAFAKGYTRGQQDARSVAHPPSGWMGLEMPPKTEDCVIHPHHKEVAPTVEKIEQAVVEWCMHWCERVAPDDSDWTDLHARLKALSAPRS